MKLMTLLPESQRLRRIAKAHAVGEFSQAEYRQARRVLLESLARTGDSPLEDTFRRTADTARRDPSMDQGQLTVTRGGVTGPRSRGSAFGWFVAGLGGLIALMWWIPLI